MALYWVILLIGIFLHTKYAKRGLYMKKLLLVSIVVTLLLCSCSKSENTKAAESNSSVDAVTSADSSTAETVDTSYTIAIEDKIYHLSNKVLSAEEKAYIDKQAADASSTRYLYDPAQQADGAITDVKADVFRLDSKYLCIKIKCDDLYRSVQKIYTDKNGIDGNELHMLFWNLREVTTLLLIVYPTALKFRHIIFITGMEKNHMR